MVDCLLHSPCLFSCFRDQDRIGFGSEERRIDASTRMGFGRGAEDRWVVFIPVYRNADDYSNWIQLDQLAPTYLIIVSILFPPRAGPT